MAFFSTDLSAGPRPSGVYAAGRNQSAQFGFSTQNIDILRFSSISNSGSIVSVAAGFGQHALYLLSDGRVLSIGSNGFGQCGQSGVTDPAGHGYMIYDQDNNTQLTSVKIFNSGVLVAAGTQHSLVLDSSGTVWACGDGAQGRLGIGTTSQREWLVPSFSGVNFGQQFKITKIAAGSNYSLILDEFGRVWTCGGNTSLQQGHQLGNQTEWRLNTEISGACPILDIYAGDVTSYFLSSVSGLLAAGGNARGQAGIGHVNTITSIVQVSGLSNVNIVKVSPGGRDAVANSAFCIARSSSGTLYSWGGNSNGQLGIGSTTSQTRPQIISGILPAIDIAAGDLNGYAIDNANQVYSWGSDGFGQLSNGGGAGSDATSPVAATSGLKFDSLHVSKSASDLYALTQSQYAASPNLFIMGALFASSGIDLYINGVGSESGFVTLVLPGQVVASGMDLSMPFTEAFNNTITLFENGIGFASGNVDLYIRGVEEANINLFIIGSILVSGNIDLYTRGVETSSGQGFIQVSDQLSNTFTSLYIKGYSGGQPITDIASDISLFISNDGLENFIDANFRGFIATTSGSFVFDSSFNWTSFIKVGNQHLSSLDLFVQGHSGSVPNGISMSSGIDLFINGSGDALSNNFTPISLSKSGFVRVRNGVINSFNLFLHNTFDFNDCDLSIFGISGTINNMLNLHNPGHTIINGSYDMSIFGISGNVNNNIGLSIGGVGSGVILGQMILYVHGF